MLILVTRSVYIICRVYYMLPDLNQYIIVIEWYVTYKCGVAITTGYYI